MYIPKHFTEDDTNVIQQVINENGFGTIYSCANMRGHIRGQVFIIIFDYPMCKYNYKDLTPFVTLLPLRLASLIIFSTFDLESFFLFERARLLLSKSCFAKN